MPVKVAYRNGKYRVVEADTGNTATNRAGTAVDGGGHHEEESAEKQARAINASLNRRDEKN